MAWKEKSKSCVPYLNKKLTKLMQALNFRMPAIWQSESHKL